MSSTVALSDTYVLSQFAVLHPAYKLQYFRDQDWPAEWINEAVDIIKTEWVHNYKPDAPAAEPEPEPAPRPSSSQSKGKERAGTSGRHSAAAAAGQVRA